MIKYTKISPYIFKFLSLKIRTNIKSWNTIMKSLWSLSDYYIYIYIYAFSRRFYPKRLTVHSGYTFLSVCVFPGNWTPRPFALLTQCSTTEPQEHRSSTELVYTSTLFRAMFWCSLKRTLLNWTPAANVFPTLDHFISCFYRNLKYLSSLHKSCKMKTWNGKK